MHAQHFVLTQRAVRLHVGGGSLEEGVRQAVVRARAKRVGILASPSLLQTAVPHVIEVLGDRYSGTTATISREADYESVAAATRLLREASPDMLVAIGGGSVLAGARAVAIFLAEQASPLDLMTRYDGLAPHSPRLDAAKLPIVNVPVTPTTAMNRSGVGLRNDALTHRMEYFDPKTRPLAIVLEPTLLAATPQSIVLHAGATVLARAFGDAAERASSPLDEADRNLALQLALAGFSRNTSPEQRIDICLAAFLQTRIEDARGRLRPRSCFAGDYGLATALHLGVAGVSQGAATTALVDTMARRDTPDWPEEARRLHRALGLGEEPASDEEAHMACVAFIRRRFSDAGMPTRVRELGVGIESLEGVAQQSMLNYNQLSAEAGVRDFDAVLARLTASW